jgi:hypothetical protein
MTDPLPKPSQARIILTPGQETAVLDVMRTGDRSFFRLQGHLWTRRNLTDLIRKTRQYRLRAGHRALSRGGPVPDGAGVADRFPDAAPLRISAGTDETPAARCSDSQVASTRNLLERQFSAVDHPAAGSAAGGVRQRP